MPFFLIFFMIWRQISLMNHSLSLEDGDIPIDNRNFFLKSNAYKYDFDDNSPD